MQNMSFYHTQPQMRAGTKTETRRLGWLKLKRNDIIRAVVKVQGLRKGEKQEMIGFLRVLSVEREPLNAIDQAGVNNEGFPEMNPQQFIDFFCAAMGCKPDTIVSVIKFKHIDQTTAERTDKRQKIRLKARRAAVAKRQRVNGNG
jgi:hypothetical protein